MRHPARADLVQGGKRIFVPGASFNRYPRAAPKSVHPQGCAIVTWNYSMLIDIVNNEPKGSIQITELEAAADSDPKLPGRSGAGNRRKQTSNQHPI
jgi:hypothetical protein